jgi:hypothetical protein
MANGTWTDAKSNTTNRMEFHLEKVQETIDVLKNAGLDIVAKKLENAYKMITKDLDERWIPKEEGNTVLAIFVKRENSEMSNEDMIKELQKQARDNANIGRI